MKQGPDFLTILRQHFLIFISAFYLALFALAINMILLLEVYPPSQQQYGVYMMSCSAGIAIYLCMANLLIIRGRPWAVWLVVTAMVACMLVALGHWGRRAPDVMYSIGLILPLATLLTLNSKRYRAMLGAMVEVRGQRIAWRQRNRKVPKRQKTSSVAHATVMAFASPQQKSPC